MGLLQSYTSCGRCKYALPYTSTGIYCLTRNIAAPVLAHTDQGVVFR